MSNEINNVHAQNLNLNVCLFLNSSCLVNQSYLFIYYNFII